MKCENGFTLIELLLVLAIIGIISAIAVPALLGQRERAKATATKDNAYAVLADISSTIEMVTDPISERPPGVAPTPWDFSNDAGLQALATEVVNIVIAKPNFQAVKNPYSGAWPLYKSAPSQGIAGEVYLDPTAVTLADPTIPVTAVYKDTNGTARTLVKFMPLY